MDTGHQDVDLLELDKDFISEFFTQVQDQGKDGSKPIKNWEKIKELSFDLKRQIEMTPLNPDIDDIDIDEVDCLDVLFDQQNLGMTIARLFAMHQSAFRNSIVCFRTWESFREEFERFCAQYIMECIEIKRGVMVSGNH